jgi:hypothetical protein
MLLYSLEESPKASKKEFNRIINTFPEDLKATYKRFLYGVVSRDREDAGKILRLLIGGTRHLTLMEMNTAFTIDQDHKSIAEVIGDLQYSIRSMLHDIVGVICTYQARRLELKRKLKSLAHASIC